MPESIYWLHANNQLEKAERVLRKAAKTNKIYLPENIFTEKISLDKEKKKFNNTGETNSMLPIKKDLYCKTANTKFTCLDFFKNRKMLLYLFVSSFAL